jgi:hypothetical protein
MTPGSGCSTSHQVPDCNDGAFCTSGRGCTGSWGRRARAQCGPRRSRGLGVAAEASQVVARTRRGCRSLWLGVYWSSA